METTGMRRTVSRRHVGGDTSDVGLRERRGGSAPLGTGSAMAGMTVTMGLMKGTVMW